MTKVLLIDDEPDVWLEGFRASLGADGFEFDAECDPERALARLRRQAPDVVLLDSLFCDAFGAVQTRGPQLLKRIVSMRPELPVVMFTVSLEHDGVNVSDFPGASSIFSKQRFARGGDAHAHLAKTLTDAIDAKRDKRTLDEKLGFVVGTSPAMRKAAEKILLYAKPRAPVLIHGETGTGKELAAGALHRSSGRKGRFIAIDCGRYTGDTLENELFGHELGAYTGATSKEIGLIEEAHGGSLFLDEIHAMGASLQDKLLRAVESGTIRRIGGRADIQVDVRFVAASNRPLRDMVAEGRFRDDLFQRLLLEIELPPLRDRLEDLPALFTALVESLNRELGKSISPHARGDVLAKLRQSAWSGNVRELRKTLGKAMLATAADIITPDVIELPQDRGQAAPAAQPRAQPGDHFDLVDRVFAKDASWEDLKLIGGEFRERILVAMTARFHELNRRWPGSKDLAILLDTTDDNVRQMLRAFGGITGLKRKAMDQG